MNISRKIILPAVSVILISWLDLNAKADTDKVQPQRLTDTFAYVQQTSFGNHN